MEESKRYELLESCPVVDEVVWLQHVTGFVTAFVAPPKRHRWLELLTRRPRRVARHSHTLRSDLDHRTCRDVGATVPTQLNGDGAFYAFFDVPRVAPIGLARELAGAGDAILSLVPGKLALYFFHEGEVWQCGTGERGRG